MNVGYLLVPCVGGGTFRIPITRIVHRSRSHFQEIAVYDTEPFGRCLVLDGLIQSTEADHRIYDRAALRKTIAEDRRVLVLGGGDGYVAATALEINPALRVTIVDLDGEVMEAARSHLGQRIFDDPRVEVRIEDALDFLMHTPGGSYDGVVCDLTDFPLGQGDDRFQLFYAEVLPLARLVIRPGGWMSVYSGSTDAGIQGGALIVDIMIGILGRHFSDLERVEVLVPSFGEPSCFIHGRLAAPSVTPGSP